MMMNTMKRWLVIGGAVALAAALAACAPEETAPDVGADEGVDQAAASEPLATAESPEPAEPEPTVPVSAAECLVGTWLADNEFPLAVLDGYGDGQLESVAGEALLTYEPDGTLITEYRGWSMTLVIEGERVQGGREGTDHGVYSTSDGTLSFADREIDSMVWMVARGARMEFVPDAQEFVDIPFTCEGDVASLSVPEGTFALARQ